MPGADPATWWSPAMFPMTPAQMGDFSPEQLMALHKAMTKANGN